MSDFEIYDHGTIVFFIPISDAGQVWWNTNVETESYQSTGGGYCVEHRYARDLIEAIVEHGFTVA